MLEEETRRAQQLQDVAGGRSAEIYGAGRGDIDWGREQLKSMYAGLGAGDGGGGDGGGPGFEKLPWESEVLPWALKLMREGAYDETTRGAMESAATAPITGMADMLRRGLQTSAAGAGGGTYGRGLEDLFRDRSYAASEASKGAFGDIAKLVAQSKLQGAELAAPIESEKRAFGVSERDKALANARARAGAGRARADEEFGQRRALIHDILGLEGDRDLAYMDRQLGGQAGGRESIGMRRDETPMWQKMGADLLKSGAGAALGAFTGGIGPAVAGIAGSAFKRKPTEGEKMGWAS